MSTLELLAKRDGSLLRCQTELQTLEARLDPGTGWRAVGKSLVWPLKEEEMQKLLSSLERLKSTMQLALSTDQATLSLALHDGVEGLTRDFQKHSLDQKRHHLYTWLAAPDHSANHATNRKKHHSKTGTWLLMSNKYDRWLHDPKSFLWIYGIPGSGKSVLCSTVIEQLVGYCQQSPQTAVAYFYFDYNDSEKRSTNSLLRSLIFQLSTQCETMPQSLLEVYKAHQDGAKVAAEDDLRAILKSLLTTFHDIYIVIDALDECSNHRDVSQLLQSIQTWEVAQLHLMAASRQLPEIQESLMDLVTDKIWLRESQMNEDIVIYISDILATDKVLAKWPRSVREEVQSKLLAGEDGMFQWVVCQLDMFRRCVSVTAIRNAMEVLPKSLDETYERILLGIDEIYHTEVMKTLKALTVSVRLLTLEEMVEILAVNFHFMPPRFDPDCRLLDPKSIMSMCCSLITTSEKARVTSTGYGETISALELVHTSVADFLLSSKPSGRSEFHFSRQSAREFLAQTCLAYLLNPEFADGYEGRRFKYEKRLKTYPFLHAASFWPSYLQREKGDPENNLSPETKEILQAFFATSKLPNGGNFALWVGSLIPDSPAEHVRDTAPLYYAASFGLTEVVRFIMEMDKDINIDALGGRAQRVPSMSLPFEITLMS
ncbi:hypothetical protein FQN54_005483 [Arachnomyces sp. PD_36]|nr:hypothetical protein FQN54_005483 [Arachnomyces sp. PD_36]